MRGNPLDGPCWHCDGPAVIITPIGALCVNHWAHYNEQARLERLAREAR